ncbi:MAG: B12-binding domain-containing radical SAM protein, partial [Acidobacteriota bacterium]
MGFFRKNGILDSTTRVVVQHDRIEGPTAFGEIIRKKVDLKRGDHDVLFITAYTNSAREAYRRAREARTAYTAAGKDLTIVLGGAHASAVTNEGTRFGHVDAVVAGEGEWAAAELLDDIRQGRKVRPLYQAAFSKIRGRGSLALDMSIWQGLNPMPQQVVASATLARGCKLDCHFCAVKLTNGPTIRNRDVRDVVEEIQRQGVPFTRETINQAGPGFFNSLLKALVRMPWLGRRYGDRLVARMGPGYTEQFFFWDDNLYNARGSFRSLCQAIEPLGRPWAAQLTVDIAEKPELLKLAHASGCRDLFLGIESINQTAIDGLDKWSNSTFKMEEMVRRVHDAGIKVMGAFVFGLEGDTAEVFDSTLEFIYKTGIDFVVANIIQPYPGTGTFKDAVAQQSFLPWSACPADSDVALDYNWPLFDGAHVLVRPEGMTVEQLQEGYYYFLRQAYSLRGISRRYRRAATGLAAASSHYVRNYLFSRYGMTKTAHAIRRKSSNPVGHSEPPAEWVPTVPSAIGF